MVSNFYYRALGSANVPLSGGFTFLFCPLLIFFSTLTGWPSRSEGAMEALGEALSTKEMIISFLVDRTPHKAYFSL